MSDHGHNRTWGIGAVLLIAALGALLGFVVWAFFRLWALAGPTHMSIHAWIAITLAGVLTLAVGCGLMWLAFHSARKGYDERGQDPRA
jgi:hypothetical protein